MAEGTIILIAALFRILAAQTCDDDGREIGYIENADFSDEFGLTQQMC